MIEFVPFPKIARLAREIIITEKIDGTNASLHIGGNGEFLTGSRTRWITPEDDNFGFSKWAHEHKEDLMNLGPGTHFGEWWGKGIQRGYGLDERRFSLFNTTRWNKDNTPACVSVVPELWRGILDSNTVEWWIGYLSGSGSKAAPGFMKPEGIVVFHTAANLAFKMTIEKDEEPKGKSR